MPTVQALTGTVHELFSSQQVTEKLKKRELVLEVVENPQYPEYIKLEAINGMCDKLDDAPRGSKITAYINFRGRPWTSQDGKKSYFNSIQIWKMEVLESVAYPLDVQYANAPPYSDDKNDDDLPF